MVVVVVVLVVVVLFVVVIVVVVLLVVTQECARREVTSMCRRMEQYASTRNQAVECVQLVRRIFNFVGLAEILRRRK